MSNILNTKPLVLFRSVYIVGIFNMGN